jgi:hemerythrin
MTFLEWDARYELGIHEFDEHHKYLIDLLNMTYDGFVGKAEHEELGAVLDALIDYATYHFASEEFWMERHDYPGLLLHREEHAGFCTRVVEIQKDFHQGKTNLSLETLEFLNSWLVNHILKTDAEYGRFAAHLTHGQAS